MSDVAIYSRHSSVVFSPHGLVLAFRKLWLLISSNGLARYLLCERMINYFLKRIRFVFVQCCHDFCENFIKYSERMVCIVCFWTPVVTVPLLSGYFLWFVRKQLSFKSYFTSEQRLCPLYWWIISIEPCIWWLSCYKIFLLIFIRHSNTY